MIIIVDGKLYTDCKDLLAAYPSCYKRLYKRGTTFYVKGGTKSHRVRAKDAIGKALTYRVRKAYGVFTV